MRLAGFSIVFCGLWSLACSGMLENDTEYVLRPLPTPPMPTWVNDPTLVDDDILVAGTRGAAITVIQYSDWQCGHCKDAFPIVLAAVESRPDAALHFRTFPLTSVTCRPGDTDDKCVLAAAALCSDDAGEFASFAPAAFADPEAVLRKAASKEATDWHTCMQTPATLQRVAHHKAAGTSDGVMGTPTLFVGADGTWAQVQAAELATYLDSLQGELPAEAAP